MAVHVLDEANRCLNCKKPKCREGCPISTYIPDFITLFRENKINEAGQLLFDNNPLSMICALVCDHEAQCEGHCILNRKGMPIHISSIEGYVSDNYFDRMKLEIPPSNGRQVAIIGAGPAGITIAFVLRRMGYEITIFDAKDKIGGVMQYGIPDFRLPKTILARYKQKLLDIGVRIRPDTVIGGALEIGDLFRDGYLSVFIGTGVWRPKTLGIVGESLGNVHFAIDYLASPEAFDLGESVAIIGTGNTAMDAARTALRHGVRKVTVVARRDTASASAHEVAYAQLDGAEFLYEREPVKITPGGPLLKPTGTDDREAKLYPVDTVMIAVSQGPRNRLVRTTEGLKASDKGLLVTDDHGETTHPGIFAAGDVVAGARTVVEAAANAKNVAQAMHEYMEGLEK